MDYTPRVYKSNKILIYNKILGDNSIIVKR